MNKKFVLYLAGGAMAGVFTAGVVTRLEELNIYEKIAAVYGSSAGALNGAFFLTRQTKKCSNIYWKNLSKNFISPKKAFPALIQRLFKKPSEVTKKTAINPIDIDYLFKIIKTKKKLNLKKLKSSKIPLYVKLINLKTGKRELFDVRKTPLKALRAAVSIVPYWYFSEKIENTEYIDGAVAEPVGLKKLLKRHPGKKIVVVMNYPYLRSKINRIKWVLEGLIAKIMYGPLMFNIFRKGELSIKQDFKIARKQKNILMLRPKITNVYQWTTNPKVLIKCFKKGKKYAEKIIKFVNS